MYKVDKYLTLRSISEFLINKPTHRTPSETPDVRVRTN